MSRIPAFVVQLYGDALIVLSEQRTIRKSAAAMYGAGWRARHEARGWIRDNRPRFDAARATLAKLTANTPPGLTMVDVKEAWKATPYLYQEAMSA